MLNPQPSYTYVYQEFPKALYHPDGKSKHPVIVKNADEEAAQIKLWTPEPTPVAEPVPATLPVDPAPPLLVPVATEVVATEPAPSADRSALIAKAESVGIKVDGRWSDKRLAAEIAAAA